METSLLLWAGVPFGALAVTGCHSDDSIFNDDHAGTSTGHGGGGAAADQGGGGAVQPSSAVGEIVYELIDDGSAGNSAGAHRVELYVLDGTLQPPNNPANPIVIDVAAEDGPQGVRVVEETLSTPIALTSGQHLAVAVELAFDAPSCIATCEGATVLDRDWWSNAAMAPYSWQALSSFDPDLLNVHARIGANGM